MIEFARYEANGTVTAGPIQGMTFHGITPNSRFWDEVNAWTTLGHTIEPYVEPPEPVPEKISDRQFFQQMAIDGHITREEAEEAVGPGTIPATMTLLLEQVPEELRWQVRMLIRGATEFLRHDPNTILIGHLYGFTDEQVDEIWRKAYLL